MPDAVHRLSLLESIIGAVNLGAIVLDETGRIVLWNQWMSRHSAWSADAVLGRDFFEVFPELQHKRIDSAIRQALRDNFQSLLSQTLHKAPFALYTHGAAAIENAAQERMQQAIAVTPINLSDSPRHCLIQINDVTIAVGREKLLREQTMVLRSQTFSDGLTGIANRRHFDVAIEREMRRAMRNSSPLSLLMIDIDHFKDYNDHYGHQQGDGCLIQVAAELAAMLQRPTDLLARYGGEEFAAILPDSDAAQALQMAEAMRQRVAELRIPHEKTGNDLKHITVSIGVATQHTHLPHQPLDIAALIGGADRALYLAKRSGRNRVTVQTT
ncbi:MULTISPECIES: sensor domain-containing diguanylate cyclase [unclassified Janthinobacterium]|uniref:sensor domain-containing diguanylate cyclase n=1 Tax=unclassified Janthinobacterium TaxID=2610881 RepID=UPI001618444B|nr:MULTISPECIES: diguanylate cyclase [unclassified Janthinobacterium]MBB5608628.1 diguanylate cyclase (GGDEF)-like protein [Janthinobacterium sp. S3T4]MBB5613969.1 diguanylate cyclase (GGDEF)-like protein [Janthinobacterium sp. S3M3]